jgi:predicted enzyme related to lactoylglutathione lyase
MAPIQMVRDAGAVASKENVVLDDQRPGTVYWIDHYTVGTNDVHRWIDFHERVLGAQTMPVTPRRLTRGVFQNLTNSHHGGFVMREPLPPAVALGQGYPRNALFIRPEDIDDHLRRLDACAAEHSDPIRTSEDGDDGTAIYWLDPDGNQFEFWAPANMPAGAMDDCGPLKVGRISHAVYESRDLQRTAAFFDRYCALEPLAGADIPDDTLVLPLAAGGRIVFKKVENLGHRTSGRGVYRDLHAALVVREEDFWPSYERVWADLPEWDFDELNGRYQGDGTALPARSALHGSPAGRAWKGAFGRGDDWYDWDTNLFHYFAGVPRNGSMATYNGHSIEDYMEHYLGERGLPVQMPNRE